MALQPPDLSVETARPPRRSLRLASNSPSRPALPTCGICAKSILNTDRPTRPCLGCKTKFHDKCKFRCLTNPKDSGACHQCGTSWLSEQDHRRNACQRLAVYIELNIRQQKADNVTGANGKERVRNLIRCHRQLAAQSPPPPELEGMTDQQRLNAEVWFAEDLGCETWIFSQHKDGGWEISGLNALVPDMLHAVDDKELAAMMSPRKGRGFEDKPTGPVFRSPRSPLPPKEDRMDDWVIWEEFTPSPPRTGDPTLPRTVYDEQDFPFVYPPWRNESKVGAR